MDFCTISRRHPAAPGYFANISMEVCAIAAGFQSSHVGRRSRIQFDHHLKRVACPAPGDQKALCELISSVYADQLDRSRPLWKCWGVEGLEGGRVATVNIIHHAYADGVAASHILEQTFSPEVGREPPETGGEWQPNARQSWFKRLILDLTDWPTSTTLYLYIFRYTPFLLHNLLRRPTPLHLILPMWIHSITNEIHGCSDSHRIFYNDRVP